MHLHVLDYSVILHVQNLDALNPHLNLFAEIASGKIAQSKFAKISCISMLTSN